MDYSILYPYVYYNNYFVLTYNSIFEIMDIDRHSYSISLSIMYNNKK